MEEILKGLERKDYDAAIGAITITPARLARVDFSYPTHRSGAAVAVRQDTGPMAALAKCPSSSPSSPNSDASLGAMMLQRASEFAAVVGPMK